MTIPYFPVDDFAKSFAEKHQPLRRALSGAGDLATWYYAHQYGERAAAAAENCRLAALAGDMIALRRHSITLSNVLYADNPHLFDMQRKKLVPGNISKARGGVSDREGQPTRTPHKNRLDAAAPGARDTRASHAENPSVGRNDFEAGA